MSCLPDFTDDSALFAVYDGHGGPEVALYVAKYLPMLLKTQYNFTAGKIDHAFKEAFLAVDKQIVLEDTADELQTLAGSCLFSIRYFGHVLANILELYNLVCYLNQHSVPNSPLNSLNCTSYCLVTFARLISKPEKSRDLTCCNLVLTDVVFYLTFIVVVMI